MTHLLFEEAVRFDAIAPNIVYITSARITKDNRMENLYYYDIRSDDEGFTPIEICKSVMVNHFGTIVTDGPIEEIENGATLEILSEEYDDDHEDYDDESKFVHDHQIWEHL